MLPQQPPEALNRPIFQEQFIIPADEYVNSERLELYTPIAFSPLSLLVSRVDKYRNLTVDKWVSSGYDSPEVSIFDNANAFLCTLNDKYLFNLNPENIEPTPYGTLVLDFSKNDKLVSIEVGKNKIGYYTKNMNLKPNFEGIDFDADNLPNEILEALEKMCA